MYLSPRKKLFVDTATEMFGEGAVITKSQKTEAAEKAGVPFPTWFKGEGFSVGYNAYKLPVEGGAIAAPITAAPENAEATMVNLVATNMEKQNLIPGKFDGFVPWGNFSLIEKVVKSGMFYPIFITGLSGNGKTLMVEQLHAELGKELIRLNITIETDEDDLLGGYRLRDGQTVWQNGPVIEAMERGAVLLLDEIDLASNKIMCLQPILEGSGIYVKKINKFVKPKLGFNVVATANTKGQGSDDGKFIGTNVLNEAFLERFPITFEQQYPAAKTEQKIVATKLKSAGKSDDKFATNLVTWADVIRKTFKDGGVDEIISTRRLVHIAEAYAIFKSKMKAIEVCTNRFDDSTKTSFVDLYTKVDSGASAESILADKKAAEEAEILSEEKQDSDNSEDDEDNFEV